LVTIDYEHPRAAALSFRHTTKVLEVFMKLRVITTALLCLTAGMAIAQPPGPHRGPDIERLTILLDLDAGQKVAVQKVLDEQRAQMQALRQQAKTSQERPTREQMHASREQMQKETKEKMQGILSDTQMKKFEALTDRPMGAPGMRWEKKADQADSDSTQGN
jgi:Spy/CpxP family protein refolding chaperone